MGVWMSEDLDRIAAARELGVATTRPDGTLADPVTVWAVRHDDDIYLRSYRADRGIWYQRVLADPHGRISIGELDHDVTFERVGGNLAAEIDAAYWDKYGNLPTYVAAMVGEAARETTLRVVPRDQ